MRISVFGLGYVGSVTAGCLARMGHEVIGVDVKPEKVEAINRGESPVVEPGLAELIAEGKRSGRLSATRDVRMAVETTELSFICVGTPSDPSGGQDLRYVARVARDIGAALGHKRGYHVVVVRSTVLPGTVQGLVLPALEVFSGKIAGKDFGLCMNPEFLREGSAVEDFFEPSRTVIGELDQASGDALTAVYRGIQAPIVRTDIRTAEMVKYADNAFHALKVVFANEIGRLCRAFDIDSTRVMDIFTLDRKLNLSPYYLRPGFAFGGSCLPKDVRALVTAARHRDVSLPVLEAVLRSNEEQARLGLQMVLATGKRRVGIVGMSFKPGTDDLRESPMVYLVEQLLGKGYQVAIYDPSIRPDRLIGSNREFVERAIPHLEPLLRSNLDEVLEESEVIVLAHRGMAVDPGRLRPDQEVIDLVRALEEPVPLDGRYHGIAW